MIDYLPIGVSVLSLVFVAYLIRWIRRQPLGTAAMQGIAAVIKEGANAFVKRQYRTIGWIAVALALGLFVIYSVLGDVTMAWQTALAFTLGAVSSGIAGIVGMAMSTTANVRSAAASKHGFNAALQVALKGGAITGLIVVSLSLMGISGLYLFYKYLGYELVKIPALLVGYGFGASLVALFAQVGGGIYTKAADVGADLVGKVEAGIPEDDPRNPAVIADLVGDNVGDCAGRGADLFESTAAENIGAMILGAALFPYFGVGGMLFPLVLRAFGLIATILGLFAVKAKEDESPMAALNRGYYVTLALATVAFYFTSRMLLGQSYLWFFAAGVVGILTSLVFVYITQYYTESRFRPVASIADASKTGSGTNIIMGMSVGLESTGTTVLTIAAALLGSYALGDASGIPGGGLYGTAVATMGMLATAAYILAMDTFGPITDNGAGIVELSGESGEFRKVMDKLDTAGNTTKALTKGYAIGSAALASFLLFSAYMDEVSHYGHPLKVVNLAEPEVFVGGLLGAMLVFLFSALAMRAVGKAAFYVIREVRDQFRENPGILQGTARPDYGRCVDIVTKGALKEMVLPGFVAVVMPIAVGLTFRMVGLGAEALAAFLMVGTIGGILIATFFNNSGGAWDNAKKYIET
ncbi:MAG: sodium-translocating pyrophosphatase, partial [Candidatus Harrisonbacteria bacterium]|nr:sodium-translocating pyrophosphatase [Candidatus Harrisonbacteria bacterium]